MRGLHVLCIIAAVTVADLNHEDPAVAHYLQARRAQENLKPASSKRERRFPIAAWIQNAVRRCKHLACADEPSNSALFRALDRDVSGKLSADEILAVGRGLRLDFTASHPTEQSKGEILQAVRDSDGSGELSPEEFDRFLCHTKTEGDTCLSWL